MTCRVIDCRPVALPEPPPVPKRRGRRPQDSKAGLATAIFASLVVVPFAGAAEAPTGWLTAGLAAGVILVGAAAARDRVRWGCLAVLSGIVGVALPRGPFPAIGPMLFVSTLLCGLLWFTARRRPFRKTPKPVVSPQVEEAQKLAGRTGELHVGQVLERVLPDEFVLINGIKLRRGAGDVDHLVVGPTGVFLLETKTMAGHIVCAPDGTWRRTKTGRAGGVYSAFIGDPAAQVERNIHAAASCLRQHCPQLFARNPVWIEGVVVFAHADARLEVEHSRVPAVRVDEAPARIVGHVPRRWLKPHDVEAIVSALMEEHRRPHLQVVAVQSGQAIVELALALPIVLALLFGTLALSRVIQAQTAVVAIAHEAARAGALGSSPVDAVARISERVTSVAPGFGVDPRALDVQWDVSGFSGDPGRVTATVRYELHFDDLPLGGWLPPSTVRAEHVEYVDPFRGGVAAGEPAGR
jgi:hypothetical protein